jgi:hypothetical protein
MRLEMKITSLIATLFAIVVLPGTSFAGLITSVTSSNAAVANVTNVTSATYNHVANGVGTGSVTIDLTVFRLHEPIQLTFNYGARGVDPALTDYTVTLNVLNSIPAGTNELDFNGFDLTNNATVSGGITSAGLRSSAPITSNRFGILYSGGFNIPNGFRWGGLVGGGPRLAPGDTAVNTFVYRLTWADSTAGSSTLNFVANPEPATILLGSLVLVPAGVAARRRRKAANAKKAELAIS